MAEDASEYLPSLGQTLSTLVPSSICPWPFNCRAELLSYLFLCVAKMPFIPPVSIARSASGLTAKERPVSHASSATTFTKGQRGEKGGIVKEQLASNLKQLGKKSQPRSFLPTAKAASGAELHANRRGGPLPSSQTDGFLASRSGESPSQTQQHKHACEPGAKAEAGHQEQVRFTLALTPEAVLLLRRRNSERRQVSAAKNGGGGVPGGASESRRRRENVSKKLQEIQPVTQRHGTTGGSGGGNSTGAEPGDISSIVKISLLNERHKYDDVEYEEEEDHGVDQHVVMKCTEWLRGLENTPVRVGHGPGKSASGGERF
ncbi:uncharacterized protein AB9W97_015230 [Spinachia spinachia]